MPNTTTASGFDRDLDVEAELTRLGLRFRSEARLDFRSLRVVEECQVRGITDREDPVVVKRYVEMMRAGTRFKPILVAEVPEGNHAVLTKVDAHHRTAAAAVAGLETLPAYVILGAPLSVLKALALKKNREHGKLLSDKETLVAVADLVDMGMDSSRIVATTGLSRAKVERAVGAHRFEARAREHGLPDDQDQERHLRTLGSTARAQIARISHDDVFIACTRLILDAGLTGTEAGVLVKGVASANSDREALQLLDADRQSRADQIQRAKSGFLNPRPSYPQQFRMHAQAILRLHPDDLLDTNPSTREDTARLAHALCDFACRLAKVYPVVIEAEVIERDAQAA